MHTTICLCAECQRLDALPLRRQGIPGARQLLLTACELATAPAAPQGRMQHGLEGLGLFDPGAAAVNQPSLF